MYAALANLELGTGLSSFATPMLFRLLGQASNPRRRFAVRLSLLGAVAATAMLITLRPANAVMVGTTPDLPPDTSMNPATPGSGWTQGDPGWANAGLNTYGLNGVYIGDGWVLSAWHAGTATIKFVENGPSYDPIPNQSFVVPNPSGYAGLTEPYADMIMYRIKSEPPGLLPLTIASQPLAVGNEVMFISHGHYRAAAETHWTVNTATDPDEWNFATSCTLNPPDCRHGYISAGEGKRWGTNHIENDQTVFGPNPPHNDANITVKVKYPDPGVTDIATIANLTVFNQNSSNPFEAQAVVKDSGSAVFHKRSGQWELAGITTNVFTWNGQSSLWAVYGDAIAFADLSSYATQIAAIKSDHMDYSIVGDVDLDGAVTNADIAIFVANWNVTHAASGSLSTWKLGDLTRDGKTDVNDFFKWRNGAGSSAAALGSLLGLSGNSGGAVPEPAALILCLGPAVFYAVSRHRPRR
jgi:hypothetical protein